MTLKLQIGDKTFVRDVPNDAKTIDEIVDATKKALGQVEGANRVHLYCGDNPVYFHAGLAMNQPPKGWGKGDAEGDESKAKEPGQK